MDNETKIAQTLSDTLPRETFRENGYPQPVQEAKPEFVDKLLPQDTSTMRDIMDYLQLPMQERHNAMVDDYIRTVYDWARDNAGTGDFAQLIRVISEQEMHMGSKLKPDRLRRLAEYVKISRIRQNLAARERELYG